MKQNIYIYVYVYVYMSKLINISNAIYRKLSAMKGKESFSIIIENLLEKESNKNAILACAGKGGINKDALKNIRKDWKKWSDKYA